jgi:hypothetical protein
MNSSLNKLKPKSLTIFRVLWQEGLYQVAHHLGFLTDCRHVLHLSKVFSLKGMKCS